MTENYLCIHGHFYQPPRENPWIEIIEHQASARPYHDWNERITRECYGPNTRARLLGQGDRIRKLINNYEYISFNFGPTLLSWLEEAHPRIYARILDADRASQVRYQGHGNALAQIFSHIIMPLACRRDKRTQIRWGLADFEHRFGRRAEGMWLAETAVDTESLDLMAQEGVKFTILSPAQARQIRPLTGNAQPAGQTGQNAPGDAEGTTSWEDVSGGRIDPTRPYRVWLDKSNRRFIDVFFYDGPISRAVAYENLLKSGKDFLSRIRQAFGNHKRRPHLVSLATDGESYGHHTKFGDMALSWLFNDLEETGLIKLTNYASFLENFPPEKEVKLFENSSWSCAHGVERWRADCGCSVNHTPGWNQAWRTPLREGLDWLRDELAAIFEERGGRLFKDPWEARDKYMPVLLHPEAGEREVFLEDHASRPINDDEKVEAFQLMESQRMSLYMFTSCGWFFDDISGLEAVQILKYAARAIDLIRPLAEKDLEVGLMGFLINAKSNDPDQENGARVYESLVRSSRLDPYQLTAHYALSALPPHLNAPTSNRRPRDARPARLAAHAGERVWQSRIFPRMIRPIRQRHLACRGFHALLGEAHIIEPRTGQESGLTYLAFYREHRGLNCLVGENTAEFELEKVAGEINSVLSEGTGEKIEEVLSNYLIRIKSYGLRELIPDTRKYIVRSLARGLNKRIKDSIGKHYGAFRELMSFFQDTGESSPEILRGAVCLMVTDKLERIMELDREDHNIDWKDIRSLVDHIKPARHRPDLPASGRPDGKADQRDRATILDEPTFRRKAQDFLWHQMELLGSGPDRIYMSNVINFLNLSRELNLEPDLWECRNMFYDLLNDPGFTRTLPRDLSFTFNELGQHLGFITPRE